MCLHLPSYLRVDLNLLVRVHHKLDSVQVQSAMANCPTNSNPFRALGGKKFNLNLRPQGQIRNGKQAHPDIAEIDAESIHVARSDEYLHGGVQQLALAATPVWFGVASENHLVHPVRQGSPVILEGEGYGGSMADLQRR
jgi:hypothetical protein